MRKFVFLFFSLILSFGSPLFAQQKTQGMFSDAKFYGEFNKHFEKDIFRPFFAWEGRMGLDMAVVREKKQAVFFKNEFLTVGGRMTQNRINIVGTSYLLEGRYQFSISERLSVGGGMAHNSSHLTQDLENLVRRERTRGKEIPDINTSDLNVLFGEVKWAPRFAFKPEITVRLQPVNFRGLRGGSSLYDLPVYLTAEETIWNGKEKRIVLGSEHEFGKNGFRDFTARLEFFAKNQKDGRFQLLAGFSPGSDLHMSSNKAWHKDGFRVGLRIVFEAK